ncbi:hypothetical protein [Brevibacterium aurantiacum]|uniref:hypothetical protein n=1 Tax=Brevibacterium aurantiacum TaxID=273384 RepID=UPI003F901B7C
MHTDIAASRLQPDMNIAHQAGEVIAHMLSDGRSIIDPTVEIWTAAAAEDLRTRVEADPSFARDMSQWDKLESSSVVLHAKWCCWPPNSSSSASTH